MHARFFSALIFLYTTSACYVAHAVDPVKLTQEFKQLPTVPEDELPDLENRRSDFRGKIHWEGLRGHTWVSFPFVENPASLAMDRNGRIYVSEANRLWQGVPDLRGANEMIRDDFQSVTVADRLAMYRKFQANFPEGWFEKTADRIIRLEDRDNNGAADHRTLFSDYFNRAEDGIGFSLLADEDDAVYFTCIPNLWKVIDSDRDGVGDEHEIIAEGFGVRVSFIGHDLHGITRGPDGMLYFSVGDRGFHIKDDDGNEYFEAGRGAIFRCEPDGTSLEVYCTGLRNPQELAFDRFGNLFTFDNTGDIGDKARMVYALPGSDSGWDMSHQSAHHYAEVLDWGDFRPEESMWVAERMFDLYNEEQPQWVYPPASHVAEGPSGVVYLTGRSIPRNLQNRFLLTNYRGAPENSSTLVVSYQSEGAGFRATAVEELVTGVAASDVDLGYDGRIYLCDFGGGWSVNTNGSIQVIEAESQKERDAGESVARFFREGFVERSDEELIIFLAHPDKRVRQAAQFSLADREGGAEILSRIAANSEDLFARLHAVWGIGQINRASGHLTTQLVRLLEDREEEVRANAVRVLGSNRVSDAVEPVLERLRSDPSPRVRSMSAIALGRMGEAGNAEVQNSFYAEAAKNGADGKPDIVLRHALLSGLERIGTENGAAARMNAPSFEERLLAVLFLRRKASPRLADFLNDADLRIRREAACAIYDTGALDGPAGLRLAEVKDLHRFPQTVQRRIVCGNYRLGTIENAKRMLQIAQDGSVALPARKAALSGLLRWENPVTTDPVLGRYRPIKSAPGRTMSSLGRHLGTSLIEFLAEGKEPDLIALATKLADACSAPMDIEVLRRLVLNRSFPHPVRVAALDSLISSDPQGMASLALDLEGDADPEVRATAMGHVFSLGTDRKVADRAVDAIASGPLPVARAGILGLAEVAPKRWSVIWEQAHEAIRPELQLDGFLAYQQIDAAKAQSFLGAGSTLVFDYCESGGDPKRGEEIYRNQGGCRQCHEIRREGGVQGPALTAVANRLTRRQILTSIYSPSSEISPGYGTIAVTLKHGSTVTGRIEKDGENEIVMILPDGKSKVISRAEVKSASQPLSAMPPLGAALPPRDLRDLVAFVATLKGDEGKEDGTEHGEEEDENEAISK